LRRGLERRGGRVSRGRQNDDFIGDYEFGEPLTAMGGYGELLDLLDRKKGIQSNSTKDSIVIDLI
jgi:hypothetical protein